MTTTTTINTTDVLRATVIETLDKPRKCDTCGRRRKASVLQVFYAESDTPDVYQLCGSCIDDMESVVTVERSSDAAASTATAPAPSLVQQQIDAILAEAQRDAAYAAEIAALDDAERAGKPAIGPETGEELPRIFNDAIRQRIAAQAAAGAQDRGAGNRLGAHTRQRQENTR